MKRSFSLIEVMISLSLVSLLLTSLFFWYNHLTSGKRELQEKQWLLVEERYCHQRLNKIFSTCDRPLFTSDEQLPNLSRGSLVFTFDRGIADDPLLCGRVLARLYHDPEKNRLCLGLWPYSEKLQEPSETYILLTDVSSMEMSFYRPPSHDTPVRTPHAGSHHRWNDETLPAIIELQLAHQERHLTFAFDLRLPIRYPGRQL